MKERDQKIHQDKIKFREMAGTMYGYTFGTNKIEFPFMTFQNDKYSEFMTQIMKNLEVRYYKSG